MKLTGSKGDGVFYIQLQPDNPKTDNWGAAELTCVMENCFLLLDDKNDWIGVQVPPLNEAIKEEAEKEYHFSESIEKSISEKTDFFWTENKVVSKKLKQEMNVDVNEKGVWGIEVLMSIENRNISFNSFEKNMAKINLKDELRFINNLIRLLGIKKSILILTILLYVAAWIALRMIK